jgi:aminoglycoside phosphotransferase (APT) family kinase protein
MERLPGEAIPRRLLRDERYARARGVMIAQLGAILARIHTIDPEAPELARRLSGPTASESSGEAEVDRLMEAVRALSVEPHPVLDLTERWLRERLPRQRSGGLVHGDFRIGNVLFDEAGVVAILDWELAHLGDPVEDLAWLCVRAWRFGNDAQSAGGIGTREELVRAYESAGGGAVDPAVLRFWEVCGNLKLALVFITQARVHLDGGHRSIELASLGRRTAEAEEEMLRLMEGGG